MHRSPLFVLGGGLLSTLVLAGLTFAQEQPAPPNPIEVQPRGPLHEAFAQPYEPNVGPNAQVPDEPPPPIREQPAEQKPDAANSQWVPGYWAWDAERQEFTWVSGVYRVPPQGRSFVPGSWSSNKDGYRWAPGYWAANNQQQIPYTPDPPAPLENGPSMPPPDANATYIPGNWVFRDDRFVWRPGYYAAIQPGRIWMPAHYNWTPRGYVFVDGYWDYPLESRGLAFAPVTFNSPVYANPDWSYQPSTVIDPMAFLDSAFALGSNYYYGNYGGPGYARFGYRPWYGGAGRYDPLFNYYGARNNPGNPNWLAGVQQRYASRGSGTLAARSIAPAARSVNTGRVLAPMNQVGNANAVRVVRSASVQPAAPVNRVPQSMGFANASIAPSVRSANVARPVQIVQSSNNAPRTQTYRTAPVTTASRTTTAAVVRPVVHASPPSPSRGPSNGHSANHGASHGSGGSSHHSGGHK